MVNAFMSCALVTEGAIHLAQPRSRSGREVRVYTGHERIPELDLKRREVREINNREKNIQDKGTNNRNKGLNVKQYFDIW